MRRSGKKIRKKITVWGVGEWGSVYLRGLSIEAPSVFVVIGTLLEEQVVIFIATLGKTCEKYKDYQQGLLIKLGTGKFVVKSLIMARGRVFVIVQFFDRYRRSFTRQISLRVAIAIFISMTLSVKKLH